MPNDMKRYADGMFGDYRRAAALIAHHANADGVNAILADAAQARRCRELVLALVGLYQMLLPQLSDGDVIAQIQRLAAKWAGDEENKPKINN